MKISGGVRAPPSCLSPCYWPDRKAKKITEACETRKHMSDAPFTLPTYQVPIKYCDYKRARLGNDKFKMAE